MGTGCRAFRRSRALTTGSTAASSASSLACSTIRVTAVCRARATRGAGRGGPAARLPPHRFLGVHGHLQGRGHAERPVVERCAVEGLGLVVPGAVLPGPPEGTHAPRAKHCSVKQTTTGHALLCPPRPCSFDESCAREGRGQVHRRPSRRGRLHTAEELAGAARPIQSFTVVRFCGRRPSPASRASQLRAWLREDQYCCADRGDLQDLERLVGPAALPDLRVLKPEHALAADHLRNLEEDRANPPPRRHEAPGTVQPLPAQAGPSSAVPTRWRSSAVHLRHLLMLFYFVVQAAASRVRKDSPCSAASTGNDSRSASRRSCPSAGAARQRSGATRRDEKSAIADEPLPRSWIAEHRRTTLEELESGRLVARAAPRSCRRWPTASTRSTSRLRRPNQGLPAEVGRLRPQPPASRIGGRRPGLDSLCEPKSGQRPRPPA